MDNHKLKVHICFKEEDRKCFEQVIDLPFKPENADVINIYLGEDAPEGKRYCAIQLRGLVYEVAQGYWMSRPDIYRELTENKNPKKKEKDELLP